MKRREKEALGAGELPQLVNYETRTAEIDARRVETARVAHKSSSYQTSLPEYNLNKGRVQELDALRVENVLTTSYLQESRDTSSRRVPSLHLPPPTSGRRITSSVTSLLTEDALKRVQPTCRLL